jgi:hypothetical protein
LPSSKRGTGTEAKTHANGAPALSVDVEHALIVKHGKVHRLAGLLHQRLQ